ncbi:hypothetical protein [Nocardiopsis baichengensis]|uniref:hypothetical protein n=1 Tax=Nocardiopsis baichengensis TaxID=280240 RepID=UPI00034AFD52|nr:hypothetical protein [Nocardiopsis baichengensis]
MDAKEIRRRARAAAQKLGIDTEPGYDRRDGWRWEWTDGPAPGQVAEKLGPAAGEVRLERRLGPRAAALAVVLQALGRAGHERSDPAAAPPDPATAPDERTGALADALDASAPLHAAGEPGALARHLREAGGLAALLRPYAGTAADAGDPLAMTPIEHLTDRYAPHLGWQAAQAWRERLATMDAADAAERALAEQAPDGPTALAAVALLGELRRAMEERERAAMDAARAAGASYTDLGRALGVKRQVAHTRHHRRGGGAPARLSSQR